MLNRSLVSCVCILVMTFFSPTGWAQETKTAGPGKQSAVTGADAAIFFRQRDWARAAEAYSKVVASNPHDGQNWANYAFSLYSLKRYDEAIKAFEKQADLGFQPATATYNIACSHALAGSKPEAMAALEKALETGFDQDNLLLSDSDLESLRGDPRFKKLLGTAPEGNNQLNRPLVHGLIRNDKVNRAGHLFVLTGRRTFSAAMNCAIDIERNSNVIFAGELTGSSPNFVGETSLVQLPCSGLRLSCSSLYWQSSTANDRRTWISPSLFAEPSIEAFAKNRDPGLEAIFEYIDSHQGDL